MSSLTARALLCRAASAGRAGAGAGAAEAATSRHCETLLKHGADPSLGSSESGVNNSCVHAATLDGHAAALSLLLRHGAAHTSAGKGGWTPLALAARSGNMTVVLPLLAAGADPDATAPMGRSAREVATVNKRAKVLEAFDKHALVSLS